MTISNCLNEPFCT